MIIPVALLLVTHTSGASLFYCTSLATTSSDSANCDFRWKAAPGARLMALSQNFVRTGNDEEPLPYVALCTMRRMERADSRAVLKTRIPSSENLSSAPTSDEKISMMDLPLHARHSPTAKSDEMMIRVLESVSYHDEGTQAA